MEKQGLTSSPQSSVRLSLRKLPLPAGTKKPHNCKHDIQSLYLKQSPKRRFFLISVLRYLTKAYIVAG